MSAIPMTTTTAVDEKAIHIKEGPEHGIGEVYDPESLKPPSSSSGDADEALAYIRNTANVEIDERTNKRLLKLIDRNIMPIMCLIYCLQFLDKTSISYASVMGLRTDTHLVGQEYSWLGSVFYLGYLAWEYPTNRLMQRLPLAKYTGVNIVIWGGILAAMAGCKNFAGLLSVRLLLGIFESSITPAFVLFTSMWYRSSEQALRVGIWFCNNGTAQIIGSFLAYGISKGVEKHGSAIPGWQIIFLVTGFATMAVGVALLWLMPDTPMQARFLTEEDKVLCIERLRVNQQGVGNKHFKMEQFKEALRDPRTWLYFSYSLIADIPNGGLTNFQAIVIQSLGFTAQESLLYSAPCGAVQIISTLWICTLAQRTHERSYAAILSVLFPIFGFLLVICLPEHMPWGKLAGYWLTSFSACAFVIILGMISTNVAGYTKKTTVNAINLIGYCVGNLIGPQTFRAKDAPAYTPAKVTIVVCWGVSCFVLYAIRWLNARENKRRDEERDAAGDAYVSLKNHEFMDLTDFENRDFRYVL
ncbi:Allantoate permease [Saitoella coloradoensis]